MNGMIRKVNHEKGFGFLETTSGKRYFFHMSALKNAKIADVYEGQDCTFEEEDHNPKGPRAEDVYVG